MHTNTVFLKMLFAVQRQQESLWRKSWATYGCRVCTGKSHWLNTRRLFVFVYFHEAKYELCIEYSLSMGFPTLACMELTSEEARKQSLKLVKEVSLSISWKMESFPANEMYTLSCILCSQRTQYTRMRCLYIAHCSKRECFWSCFCMLMQFGSKGLTYKKKG